MSRPTSTLLGLIAWSCVAALLVPSAHAQQTPTTAASQRDHNPLIARGQQEYDELRFEEALQTLSAALVRSGNAPEEMARIYRLLAFTYLALGRTEEASGAYRSMLPITPDFEPGENASPHFREFFGAVKTAWEAEGRPGTAPPLAVTIRHRSPPRTPRGERVTLSASVEDPGHRVGELVLAYRQGSEAVFRRIEARAAGDALIATIPARDVAPPLLEYYFEALDAQGLPIAARGDVAAPLRITVPAPEGGSVLDEWWFWAIVGVVVAGGVVTGVVLANELGGQNTGQLVITVD